MIRWLVVLACFLSLSSMTLDATLDRILDSPLGEGYDKVTLQRIVLREFFNAARFHLG